MIKGTRISLLLAAALACVAFAQQPQGDMGKMGKMEKMGKMASPMAMGDTSPEAQEVMKFERDMEAATVRGDVAYVDSITAPDFSFTHGSGWVNGGKSLSVDDKAGYLKRVENKVYLVREPDSVKVEMHGDTAITYGRYIAQNRSNGGWISVWYERVYQKRDGVHWLYVSHRTVYGPTSGKTREEVADK
jgi:hypothetical protein